MKRDPAERRDPRETPEDEHARRTMDPTAYRAYINASLVRKISAWAGFHETCPRAGCRRNGRCLNTVGRCRAVSHEPMTDEERLDIGRQVRQAVEAELARRRQEERG